MDSIVHRLDPTTAGPGQGPAAMLNPFNDCPEFNEKTVHQQNVNLFNALHNECDKQDGNHAIKSFMDLLSESLRKKILGKVNKEMKFSEIFMIFIDNERPQSGDLYASTRRDKLPWSEH